MGGGDVTDLEQAVHALTRETRTKVIQDGDGSTQSVAIVIHAPLLTQLAEAVTSAIGSGGGGGTATGSVLNDGAYDIQVFRIRSTILEWAHALKVPPSKDLIVALEGWAEAFARTDTDAAYYLRTMEGWVALIVGLLDPPSRLELTEACPVCNNDEFTDPEGRVLKFPVVVEFRRDRPGEAKGLCRACAQTWDGVTELRRLRWDIGVKEVG